MSPHRLFALTWFVATWIAFACAQTSEYAVPRFASDQKLPANVSELAQMFPWNDRYIKPEFILIGQQKCGSTSLFQWLSRHPLIWKPAEKEICFFTHVRLAKNVQMYNYTGDDVADFPKYVSAFPERPAASREFMLKQQSILKKLMELPRNRDRQVEQIRRYSSPEDLVSYEGCVTYAEDPQSASKIHAVLPNVKILVLLRNPVVRVESAFKHGFVAQWGRFEEVAEGHYDAAYFVHMYMKGNVEDYMDKYDTFREIADRLIGKLRMQPRFHKCVNTRSDENDPAEFRSFQERLCAAELCHRGRGVNQPECSELQTLMTSEMRFALDDAKTAKLNPILRDGFYYKLMKPWFVLFDNVLPIVSEEMFLHPASTMDEVYDFLHLPRKIKVRNEYNQRINSGQYWEQAGLQKGLRFNGLDAFHRSVLYWLFREDAEHFVKRLMKRENVPASWGMDASLKLNEDV